MITIHPASHAHPADNIPFTYLHVSIYQNGGKMTKSSRHAVLMVNVNKPTLSDVQTGLDDDAISRCLNRRPRDRRDVNALVHTI